MAFLDTMGLVALVNRRDIWHDRAARVYDGLSGAPKVTTSLVLVEAANVLRDVRVRHLALALKDRVDAARARRVIGVVQADQALIDRGWQLYPQRPDKSYSLVDCISFVVMRDRGIAEAFTHDQHLEQEGFVALLE
jgi:predicted nucleic acid-binding protein